MPETEGTLREQAETPLQNDDFSETFGDPDRQENEQHIDRKRAEKKLGATVLSSIGFERRHDIVKSSFDKARQRGDKLDGKNNDRRNYAYIERLENLIGKHGNDLEKKAVASLCVQTNNQA